MNFTAKFQDYYEFNRRLDRYIHSYFQKLYKSQEEVKDFKSYPIGKTTTIAEQGSGIRLKHYNFDEEVFDEPYLVMTWEGSYADHGVYGTSGVPVSEFTEYAKGQWELDKRREQVPRVCRGCWWHEGGACFNEELGTIEVNPETRLREGHEIDEDQLRRCGKARRHLGLKVKPKPTRFERLMNNALRRDQ